MAFKTSLYELHHHFPKLAEESGFTFNTHHPRSHTDWNKIRHIDIENLIRGRKFVLIEQHLSDILNCVLESEFDVRILDEGVLKMFRLAQLAVEYQQFCRHYLDRSVYVLREELTALAQELDVTKKDLREKDEELRKLRKRTKHTYRTPLPYGNDNIATMILKTLTNKNDIFASTSNGDTLQYNKCTYCDKVFLNQLYLKSHISRRHTNALEIPERDVSEPIQSNNNEKENTKLNDEIMELKLKLKEMETFMAKVQNQASTSIAPEENHEDPKDRGKGNNIRCISTKTKDAEVLTNNEDYLLDKIEAWKKEEAENYNKEINLLRTQIIETIHSLKEKEIEKPAQNESHLIEQLHVTIKQQGAEILVLKQELTNSKLKLQDEEGERKKEIDAQMTLWSKRAEAQTKQYDALLQKLNEVAKEAHDSRALAEAERERAKQLQTLLQQGFSNKRTANENNFSNHVKKPDPSPDSKRSKKTKKSNSKGNLKSDRAALENLHRKAQELLSIRSTSSSDISSASIDNEKLPEKPKVNKTSRRPNADNFNVTKKGISQNHKLHFNDKVKSVDQLPKNTQEVNKIKDHKLKNQKSKSYSNIAVQESPVVIPGSPIKVVRAKITEEVNNRLVSVGVDPLKSRLAQSVFQKQKMQLQQEHESKSKKNPVYQKVKHAILAYLDSSSSDVRKEVAETPDYISPSKAKAFSFTSVISNVKSKALSLVRQNDLNSKAKRNALNAEVAKKAMFLLQTPPGSAPVSPAVIKRNSTEMRSRIDSPAKEMRGNLSKAKLRFNPESVTDKNNQPKKMKKILATANDSDDKSDVSDHKYYNSAYIEQKSPSSVESLIKSPARRPASANVNTEPVRKFTIGNGKLLVRTQSAVDISELESEGNNKKMSNQISPDNSSDDVESLDVPFKKSVSAENVQNILKQTKGVLKNASSTSSLNKKKVLFDMEAIQMKSVSASPSQSVTDKSDTNEKFELGLVNVDGEEWDISSIENEPLKNDTKIQFNTRTSPKIAELKQTIELQLARRNETPSTALVGGVDVLAGIARPIGKAASVAGSNTSLGSSILDESESIPVVNNRAFVKPKKVTEKDDSELDISEYSIDGITNRKDNESF